MTQPPRVTFMMEVHVGLRTYYENLRRFVDKDSRITATWTLITYNHPNRLLRSSLIPAGIRGTLNGAIQVRDALQKTSPDVVFYNTQITAVLGGRRVSHKPYVIATDVTPIQYNRMAVQYNHTIDRNPWVSRYKHNANKRAMQGAARLLPWSTWVGDSMVADYGVRRDLIRVAPPGIDLGAWAAKAHYRQNAATPVQVLFVGGDFERKGGQILLSAFNQLPAGQAELHIVTRSNVAAGENVHLYHGLKPNSPELLALYRNCDLFVLPTLGDAQAVSTEEASAVGLPIISTQIGALSDVVIEGETGFLTPVGDAAAFAARLRQCCDDPALCERMGRAARVRAEKYFDAQKIADLVVDTLIDIINEQGGTHV